MTSGLDLDVSVVVPSAREEVLTTDSVPPEVEDVQVRRDEGLNRARNAGVENAAHDLVVILDDDLVFSEDWFRGLVGRVRDNPDAVFTARGTGILPKLSWPPGFEPGMGRVMAFHRHVWQDASFPEPCSHGGDTDFFMSAYENGYTVTGIDHEWDHLDDEEDRYTVSDNLEWLWFLTRRHAGLVVPRLPSLVLTKVTGVVR
jgi:glycosyltransferase involved in cell wall biosynthesis